MVAGRDSSADRDRGPRTLKVLFALARGGTAIVTPEWVFASQRNVAWVDPNAYFAGFGPPRPLDQKLLRGRKLHVVASSLTASDPPRTALVALVSAAGGKAAAQRSASLALVGEEWTFDKGSASLRALAKKRAVVKTRWLFDLIESNNPGHSIEPYVISKIAI